MKENDIAAVKRGPYTTHPTKSAKEREDMRKEIHFKQKHFQN